MMRQTTNESFTLDVNIFESTQVALNIEFLSLMPASINQSSFFVELAEEMQLTFCEQIDNGCPVLLGLWSNVLKAEKKLEKLLQTWKEERSLVQYFKSLTKSVPCVITSDNRTSVPCVITSDNRTSVPCVITSDNRKSAQVDILATEAQLESSCVVNSTLILPSNTSTVVTSGYDATILTSSPQLYIVSSEVTQQQAPQLLRCTIANVKTTPHNDTEEQRKEKMLIENNEDVSGIKEIYVDINVSPMKKAPVKKRLSKQHVDIKATPDQHPLDKLCQLLCIDEDETIERRLTESERKQKLEEKLPYKYFCNKCSFKAKRENHLVKHIKLHEKIKDLFCCDQCDFKTIRESVLCRHKMQHSSTQIVCKFCPYKTDSWSYLMKHVKVRHGPSNQKDIKCNYCDFTAATARKLQRHHKLAHKPDSSPKFWKCPQCPYKSKLRAHLSRHENDVHGSARQFLCHYCGKSFKRNDTLTQHKIIHGEVKKIFKCQHCSKVCTSSVFLREHLASHTTERPFLCDMCGSSFKTRGATQRHKRALHSLNVLVYPCTQCKCTFKNRTDLNRHRKTHRLRKTEATIVPAVISGANVQGDMISMPITIQVCHQATGV